MIWNLEINDPNIRTYLQREKETLILFQNQNQQLTQALDNIQDESLKKLIYENISILKDKKLVQSFSQQLQICSLLQSKFTQVYQSIENCDITTIIHVLREISEQVQQNIEVLMKDQEVKSYVTIHTKKVADAVAEKYESQIVEYLISIGYPDHKSKLSNKQFQIAELHNYTRLIACLMVEIHMTQDQKHTKSVNIQIPKQDQSKFLFKLFTTVNQHFNYHFMDVVQVTSDIAKPDWMLTYIYENIEPTLISLLELHKDEKELHYLEDNEELEKSVKVLALVMVKHYVVYNIKQRINRDADDFLAHPNLGLHFLEEVYSFSNLINEFFKKYLNFEYNIFQVVVMEFEESKIFQAILEWEIQLFTKNIFAEYEEKIRDNRIHEFLNLVEEFEIVWNSQFEKYKKIETNSILDQVSETQKLIFSNYLILCKQYFSIIKNIEKKDYVRIDDKFQVQFLQTYYIGLKTIKKQFIRNEFKTFKQLIKSLTNATLTKYLEQISQECADAIYQQLYTEYLFDDQLFPQFCKIITKITLYQNHQIYFLQSQNDYSKKINNFYYKSNLIINSIVAERLISREYTTELSQKVARIVIKRLQEQINTQIKKLEFTQDGLLIFYMSIVRTTYIILLTTLNMEQHKYFQLTLRRFEQIQQAITSRYQMTELSSEKLKLIYSSVNEKDLEVIKNAKVIKPN